MKLSLTKIRRPLLLAQILLAGSAGMAACANDEDAATSSGGPPTTLQLPDAGDAAPEADLGDSAPPPDPCLPQTFCPVNGVFAPGGTLDLRTRVRTIRGRAANDVWLTGAHGAALHFDGTSWQSSNTGGIETLIALWLRAPGEIGIANFSSIYVNDLPIADAGVPPSDGGWTHLTTVALPDGVSPPTGPITSAWSDPNATWTWMTTEELASGVGFDTPTNGLWRARYVATSKTIALDEPFPDYTCSVLDCRQLLDIHGASADDLWAVGFRGAAVHIQNAQATTPTVNPFDSVTWAGLNGVWAASATDVWMVGGKGTMRHYSGQAGHTLDIVDNIPTTEDLNAIWGTSSSDIWAVGAGPTVLHYDGKTWTSVPVTGLAGRKPSLWTVWTATPGQAWIGGDGVLLSIGGAT